MATIKNFNEFNKTNEHLFNGAPSEKDATIEDMESTVSDILTKVKQGIMSIADAMPKLKDLMNKQNNYPLSGAQI